MESIEKLEKEIESEQRDVSYDTRGYTIGIIVKKYSEKRPIRNISKKFGINVGYSKNDKDLLFIKNCRNKLAHGEKRYLDVCNHNTKSEIGSYKEHAYAFMNRVIAAFEKVYV